MDRNTELEKNIELYDFTCSLLKQEQLEQEVYSLKHQLKDDRLDAVRRLELVKMLDLAEAYLSEYEKIEDCYSVYRQEEGRHYGF
jgi:hypothetical protein